jgi:hypothetical protein
MKKILFCLLSVCTFSTFASAAQREIEYSISGYGQIPDYVRVNYLEVAVDPEQCRTRSSNQYQCFGSLSLNFVRSQNNIEVRSAGVKTHDMTFKAIAHCHDEVIELTPRHGLYARRASGESGLYLSGVIDLSACLGSR